MKVRTIRPGFYGSLREIGEEFDVAEGVKGSWFEAAETGESIVPKPKRATKDAKLDADPHGVI